VSVYNNSDHFGQLTFTLIVWCSAFYTNCWRKSWINSEDRGTNFHRREHLTLRSPFGVPGNSVSVVYGYGWTIGRSRFDPRQRRKDFSSSLCVQTGSGAYPASCPLGTEGTFPGAKARPLTTHPHLVPRSRMSRSYTSSPPSAFLGCIGTAVTLDFFYTSSCYASVVQYAVTNK
jgi:hypothetical protein